MPAGVVEAVEVAHGAASALYGTDGVGGRRASGSPSTTRPRCANALKALPLA